MMKGTYVFNEYPDKLLLYQTLPCPKITLISNILVSVQTIIHNPIKNEKWPIESSPCI